MFAAVVSTAERPGAALQKDARLLLLGRSVPPPARTVSFFLLAGVKKQARTGLLDGGSNMLSFVLLALGFALLVWGADRFVEGACAAARRLGIPSVVVGLTIVAIGTSPNPLIRSTTPGLETNRRGCIVADDATGLTSKDGVFAGGDTVTGAATVILAMGAGKRAAAAMDKYIKSKK